MGGTTSRREGAPSARTAQSGKLRSTQIGACHTAKVPRAHLGSVIDY